MFVLLLTACNSFAPSQNSAPTPSAVSIAVNNASGKETVELYAPWSGQSGTEMDALHALEDVFHQQYPNLDILHMDTGGFGGGDTSEYLIERLRREQPPDSFVVHAGKESLDYVVRGELEPITKIFRDEKLDQVMPPLLLEQLEIHGEVYSIPVDIHRSNVLWYNPKIFRENNLVPPRTLDDFFVVAEKLQAKGITPLALAGNFALGHLFESVLLATYGAKDYVRLVNGDAGMWADARLSKAIAAMKRMLAYSNPDHNALNWVGAAQLVLDGKAGMNEMGDWADGTFIGEGMKPNVDYAWTAAPGTAGTFLWLSDSFTLAKGAPHRQAAIEFLKTVGSREAQDAFNRIKGSIPARVDADKSLYDAYQQWSIDQFRTSTFAPSIMHGAATSDAFRQAYSRAVIDFADNGDEAAFAEKLRAAVVELR